MSNTIRVPKPLTLERLEDVEILKNSLLINPLLVSHFRVLKVLDVMRTARSKSTRRKPLPYLYSFGDYEAYFVEFYEQKRRNQQ